MSKVFLLLVMFLLLIPLSVEAETEHERLEKGETVRTLETVEGYFAKRGVIRGVLNASIENIRKVILDYDHYEEFMPRVEKSRVLEKTDKHIRYFSRIDMPFPISDVEYECKVELTKNPGKILFSMVPGTGKGVRHFEGNWKLEPFSSDPKKSLVQYTVLFESVTKYPKWIVNLGTKKSLDKVIQGLRKRLNKKRQRNDRE